jgi:hypothetical protein
MSEIMEVPFLWWTQASTWNEIKECQKVAWWVGWLVGRLVGWSVGWLVGLVVSAVVVV